MHKRNHYLSRVALGLVLCAISFAHIASAPAKAAVLNEDGSVDLSAIVPGPPPATAPTIDYPTQNMTFSEKNIPVNGGCIAGLIVKIFRNTNFAGSALCQPTGTYSLQIDLTEGRNDLVALQYDFLNQPSPESETVTVYYLPPSQQPTIPDAPGGGGGGGAPLPPEVARFQLIIQYDYTQQVVFAGEPFRLPIQFAGGTPPYAVSIEWGDGKSTVVSRQDTTQFNNEHIYEKPGLYKVVIRVSDSEGNQAFLQFVILVNGNPSIIPQSVQNLFRDNSQLLMLWFIFLWVIIGVIGFILGMLFGRKGWKPRHFKKAKK